MVYINILSLSSALEVCLRICAIQIDVYLLLTTISIGDGGRGHGPLKFGKNIFWAIIMQNSGIFLTKIM